MCVGGEVRRVGGLLLLKESGEIVGWGDAGDGGLLVAVDPLVSSYVW